MLMTICSSIYRTFASEETHDCELCKRCRVRGRPLISLLGKTLRADRGGEERGGEEGEEYEEEGSRNMRDFGVEETELFATELACSLVNSITALLLHSSSPTKQKGEMAIRIKIPSRLGAAFVCRIDRLPGLS
jgi:hypothetical protein